MFSLMDIRRMKIILLLLWSFCWIEVCAAVEFDISYTPVKNGGAEEGLNGWFSKAVTSVPVSCSQGTHCFQFIPSADSCSELRSEIMSIRKGETLQFCYSLKTDANFVIEKDSAYAAVRSYALDKKTILSDAHFDFKSTNGKWIDFKQTLIVNSNAYYIDVRFIVRNSQKESAASYIVYVDTVSIFREIRYNPLYGDIKPLSEGDTLYVVTKNRNMRPNQFIAFQTLQGVVSRTSRPWIWIDAGDNTFLDNLEANYKIRSDRKYTTDFIGLLGELKKYTSGKYVLYDITDKPSITAATTLSGLLDAVAIDVGLQNTAIEKGYILGLDVRGKDCRWVYENYRDQLNCEAIIVHTNNIRHHRSAYYLQDISPALKALCWWYNDLDYSLQVYQSMAPCTPVYGWQDAVTSDEGLTVKMHSEEGLFQIPSDWMLNLSVHASMGKALKDKIFTQKVARGKPAKETQVHYVTFILSDMDNILTEIGTNSFYSNPRFYRNPHRGQFPMSWGMAPSLVELSPAGLDLWYSQATPKDVFVAYCGLGYFYPSVAPYMQTHALRLSKFMERADLKTILLIDRLLPDAKLDNSYYEKIKWFTSLQRIRGFFYLEYVAYASHQGKIFWFDGKPLVTARFDLREEQFYPAVRSTARSLADSINQLPKDPASLDGYTMVTVHAWSRNLDDIYNTIQLLDHGVRVVDAEEFIEQLRQNVKPTNEK